MKISLTVSEIKVEATVQPAPGWGFPANSRKAHWFVAGRALCGKWFYLGHTETGNDTSPDNCKACLKRRDK